MNISVIRYPSLVCQVQYILGTIRHLWVVKKTIKLDGSKKVGGQIDAATMTQYVVCVFGKNGHTTTSHYLMTNLCLYRHAPGHMTSSCTAKSPPQSGLPEH